MSPRLIIHGNKELLIWATHVERGSQFYCYKDLTQERYVLNETLLDEDGHPTYSQNKSKILLDRYSKDRLKQSILIYHDDSKSLECLGIYDDYPPSVPEVRCDLHPRWSRDNQLVCFDSMMNGIRSLYTLNANAKIGT